MYPPARQKKNIGMAFSSLCARILTITTVLLSNPAARRRHGVDNTDVGTSSPSDRVWALWVRQERTPR